MTLPQELIDMILFKFKGLEHPTAKIMKEDYFEGELDYWKEFYDEWNKLYFNNFSYSKEEDEETDDEPTDEEIEEREERIRKFNDENELTDEEIEEIEYIKEFERMRFL